MNNKDRKIIEELGSRTGTNISDCHFEMNCNFEDIESLANAAKENAIAIQKIAESAGNRKCICFNMNDNDKE